MYSGMFTHYIKPVLPVPQILELFGLIGYKASSARLEQLHRQSSSFTSLENLLCLSCAFFLARCECCLLLAALGKYAGASDWELSLVQERQRGHSVLVSPSMSLLKSLFLYYDSYNQLIAMYWLTKLSKV